LIALCLLFALLNGAQYITRLFDAGEVNLGTVAIAVIAAMAGGGCTAAATALEMQTHTLGFIAFERAGVRLFLCHAHIIEDVENRPAFHLELTR
jgi:hypothetical protein